MEYTIGKAANRPAPPSTSQVSFPSHTGATEFIITSRSAEERAVESASGVATKQRAQLKELLEAGDVF